RVIVAEAAQYDRAPKFAKAVLSGGPRVRLHTENWGIPASVAALNPPASAAEITDAISPRVAPEMSFAVAADALDLAVHEELAKAIPTSARPQRKAGPAERRVVDAIVLRGAYER